jgi:hypothetical protein
VESERRVLQPERDKRDRGEAEDALRADALVEEEIDYAAHGTCRSIALSGGVVEVLVAEEGRMEEAADDGGNGADVALRAVEEGQPHRLENSVGEAAPAVGACVRSELRDHAGRPARGSGVGGKAAQLALVRDSRYQQSDPL